jgi:hypothetical protein
MIAGGTFNTRVFQNDLNQIQSGQYTGPTLLKLPLLQTFHASGGATFYGTRPDSSTITAGNPIVGNVANGAQIIPSRIHVPQPTNCIQLVWHALDFAGNYQCSYPIQTGANTPGGGGGGFPMIGSSNPCWAFGWLRLNGLGPWLPMSLLPSAVTMGTDYLVFPFGGFSSIAAPMSFFDWVGYWDGAGVTGFGPDGASNTHILAIASVNLSLSSNGETLGSISNYASPSGSGIEPQPPNTDTQRNQDILVRSNNGR